MVNVFNFVDLICFGSSFDVFEDNFRIIGNVDNVIKEVVKIFGGFVFFKQVNKMLGFEKFGIFGGNLYNGLEVLVDIVF